MSIWCSICNKLRIKTILLPCQCSTILIVLINKISIGSTAYINFIILEKLVVYHFSRWKFLSTFTAFFYEKLPILRTDNNVDNDIDFHEVVTLPPVKFSFIKSAQKCEIHFLLLLTLSTLDQSLLLSLVLVYEHFHSYLFRASSANVNFACVCHFKISSFVSI